MQSTRMKIVQLPDNVYLLDDAGESTVYVVVGAEKAMVIDTANGHENLLDIVRTLTDLPLIVVNTHGHCDHIFGNAYFDEAWLHPDDEALAQEHFGFKPGYQPCPFRYLAIGQTFDLGGGDVLEAVSLKGHTAGSVGLLDRKRRILFSGDGCNPHIWMQLKESQGITVLRDTLTALLQTYGDNFDTILYGHAHTGGEPKALLHQLMTGCDELLHGQTGNDRDYTYFAGTCRFHPIDPADPDRGIVYTPDQL